jgi:hypothetical protein
MAPRVAQYAPQLQVLLDEPEMQAALAASPSLRRALRPLCRGLAFPTPSVMVEARRSRRSRAGRADGSAGNDAAVEPHIEADAEAAGGLAGPFVPTSNHTPRPHHDPGPNHNSGPDDDPRPAGRDSPRVAPAVLRMFTR